MLIVLIFGNYPGSIFGQTYPDVPGFDANLFTYHFDRADREITPERWLNEARRGISLARRLALELYGEPGSAEAAEQAAERQIDEWSESELERRFTEWLLKGYFGEFMGALTQSFSAEIGDTNRQYLFHTGGDGRVMYDSDTGDPLVIRPGEGDIVIDRQKWRQRAAEAVSAGVGEYKSKLAELYPELLAYIPDERRAGFETKLEETALAASLMIQREFEGIALREERLFIARRTGDVFSLRRKSDDEAASMISARLIGETEALCAEGIADLEERIEAAEGGGGDLILAGTEWLAAYREQFERGLKAWEEAEEQFFIRRIEWEQEAGKQYTEGEEAWSAAFVRFEEERRNWEVKAKALFESGERLFQRASENMERAIAQAKAEFETDAKIRTETGAERAKAWVDMYITAGSVVTGAQENLDFWLERYGAEEAPPLGSDELIEWLDSRQRDDWLELQKKFEKKGLLSFDNIILGSIRTRLNSANTEDDTASMDEETYLNFLARFGERYVLWYEIEKIITGKSGAVHQAAVLEKVRETDFYYGSSLQIGDEIRQWSKLYAVYMEKALESRDALINDFAMVIGTGGLTDILAPGAASEDFNLDEYQIELIRARAVAGYWSKRVSIAEAVLAYAEEISAGRITDGEGVKAWEAAKGAYDEAILRYEAEQNRLVAAGDRIKEARESLNEAAEALQAANNKLEELNQAYAILMAAYSESRGDFMLEELASKYRELLKQQDLLNAAGIDGAYMRYLERARELGFALELEGAGEILQRLVAGDNGEPSLAALREAALKITVPGGDDAIPGTVEACGLEPEDPYYAFVKGLLDERNQRIAAAGDAAEKAALGEGYKTLIAAAIRAAKSRAEILLENRVQGLNMLLAGSAEDWYFSARAYEPAQADLDALKNEGLEERLYKDADWSQRALLLARIELELEGLNYILTGESADSRAVLLSSFYIADPGKTEEFIDALNYLREIVAENINGDAETYRGKLEKAAGEGGVLGNPLGWFILGGSFFHEQWGAKITEGLLPEYTAAKERDEGLLNLYRIYGWQTPAAAREKWEHKFLGLSLLFDSYGIETSGKDLPGITAMGTAVLNQAGIPGENLAVFLYKLDEQLNAMPEWMKTEFDAWKSSFIEYIAACQVYLESGPEKSLRDIQEKERALQIQLQGIQKVYDALGTGGPESARALCAALEINSGGFALLNRDVLETGAVKRIGAELAILYGSMDILDEAALRAALEDGAARYHDYAGAAIRQKAVEEAMGLLRLGYAVDSRGNADGLEGETGRIRLNQLFFEMGIGGAEQNTDAARIGELARAFAGFTEEDSPSLLAFTRSYVDDLRDRYGEAAVFAERMLGAALALNADNFLSFKAILEALDLHTGQTPESLYEQVLENGFNAPPDILRYKSSPVKASLAGEGMLFYLKHLLYGGDWEAYQRELDAFRSYIAAEFKDDPEGLAGQERYLREAEAFAGLLRVSRSYLGSAVSGDPVEWALRQSISGIYTKFDLARLILNGVWDDPFITALVWPDAGQEAGPEAGLDAYRELLNYELNNYYLALLRSVKQLGYENALAGEYERILNQALEAEQEGENHWRQYITEGFLSDYNDGREGEGEKLPAGITEASGPASGPASGWDYKILKGALNQREGILADALVNAERKRQILKDAFALYDEKEFLAGMDTFKTAVRAYQNNTSLDWDPSALISVPYRYYDNYYLEAEELQKHTAHEEYLRLEIGRLGMGYDIMKKGMTAILAEKEKKLNEIDRQQEEYAKVSGEYAEAAEVFLSLGKNYDEIYEKTKRQYDDLENARFRYETQDAIRRWASTAYLDAGTVRGTEPYKAPYDDVVYSKERWERAKIVLEVLAGLYDNGETRRPYEDADYEELYKKYEESFGRMILSLRALDSIDTMIRKETQKNDAYYQTYRSYLAEWGNPPEIDSAYTSPEDKSEWDIKDIISIRNGKLAFARNVLFDFSGISGERAAALEEYFKEDKSSGTETNKTSLFEEALRGLNERMAGYAFDSQRYKQWGLARDFLIRQLISQGSALEFLEPLYEKAKALEKGQNLGEMPTRERYYGLKGERQVYDSAAAFENTLAELQKDAWTNLSQQEREDLEFYTILTILGGGGKNSGAFSQISELEVFRYVFNDTLERYNYVNKRAKRVLTGWFYRPDRDMLEATMDHIKPSMDLLARNVSRGLTGMNALTVNLTGAYNTYKASCDYIAALLGDHEENEGVVWDDLLRALKEAGDLNEEELEKLGIYWTLMNQDAEGIYKNNIEALRALAQWSKNTKEDIKGDFEQAWSEDEEFRRKEELLYRERADSYVSAGGSSETLSAGAENAFGVERAAGKNHLENLERVIMQDLGGVMEYGSGYRMEYIGLAGEYTGLIKRAYAMRYNAELAAREAEWDQQRRDVLEKYNAWQKTAALILERGREDWKSGTVKLQDAYYQWTQKYREEYLRVNDLWAASYLAGLEDKETWIAQATAAANSASSGAMLALVGADAELMARAMDTRLPSGMTGLTGAEEARNKLTELLENAGTANLVMAFNGINGTAETLSTHFKRGIGGPVIWNTGTIQMAAASFAKETNSILADREAKKVAANVREITEEAIKNLGERVEQANRGFRENMDNIFVVEGQWKRNGRNYIKDVIVHSTLFDPVITEQIAIEGYKDYRMEPVALKTDLNENRLKDLDFFAVQALIEDMINELNLINDDIFGTGEENGKEGEKARTITIDEYEEKTRYIYKTVIVTGENGDRTEQQIRVPEKYMAIVKSEDRTTGAGKFGSHIGYHPVMKTGIGAGQGKDEIFVDKGTGQLGTLMSDYLYWTIQEGKGINAMSLAAWDKPMWDSRNSRFNAPSVRGVVDLGSKIAAVVAAAALAPVTGGSSIAGAVAAAAAISTSISMSDDLIFGAMDVGGGYKSFGEAGFEFGKKALISAAGSVMSSAFSGIGTAAVSAFGTAAGGGLTGASKVITQTAMTGMRTITTSTVSSALNAFTYDREQGFGWSADLFDQGIRGGAVNALLDMTGTFTGGVLGELDLYDGNYNALSGNIFSREKIAAFNDLAGGLAQQGVSYALGGDFTLNLLNAKLLTGGKADMGLLELRFGSDGAGMELGGGGMDLSPGALMAAAGGLYDVSKIGGAKLASLFGKDDPLFTLNAVNMLGYTGNRLNEAIGRGIWENKIKVVYNALGTDEGGNEIIGQYNHGSSGTMDLSETLLGKGNEKAVKLASVMAHEGVHLAGSRYEYAAYGQSLGTYTGLISQLDIDGDAGFLNMMIDELYNPASYSANTGSTDYWILKRDGALVNDNQGYLKDENGLYINKDGSRTAEIIPGQTIGAAGIETGLLNILYGGTGDIAYGEFSDEQIANVQELLQYSGFKHNGAEALRDRYWSTGNNNKVISFASLKYSFGNTIAAQVFMNGMDKLSDSAAFGYTSDRLKAYAGISEYMLARFVRLVEAKKSFYDGAGALFQSTEGLFISQFFAPDGFYTGGQHRGLDVSGAPETPVQSGFSGKVVRNYHSDSAGNSLVVEYGFNFEDSFYSTGIQAQFMHLKYPSGLAENTFIVDTETIGFMGNTGLVIPAPSQENPNAGTHLHYQLMGNLSGYGAGNKAWTMLEDRRNRFLAQIGAPSSSKYAVNRGSLILNNYTGMGYDNYFYNPNNFALRMGIPYAGLK